MSYLSNGILGALAASITLGAIQFASGNDLPGAIRSRADVKQVVENPVGDTQTKNGQSSVNRSAKADRVAGAARSSGQDRTLSFRVDQMPDTLVLIRVSAARTEPVTAISPMTKTAAVRKSTLACEPVVSVLTDVAKVLEPGRCLT